MGVDVAGWAVGVGGITVAVGVITGGVGDQTLDDSVTDAAR